MRFEWPQFSRCCFCMPLRRGVLTFGYVSLTYHLLMITALSIAIHNNFDRPSMVYSGVIALSLQADISLAFMLLDTVFVALFLYGAHMKIIMYIKTFLYYGVTTTVGSVVLQITQTFFATHWYYEVEFLLFTVAGIVIQVYLLLMIRSLLTKLERSGPHHYEDQLNQIVANGDPKSNNETPSLLNPPIAMANHGTEK